MNSGLILLLWGFIGTFILCIFFTMSLHPWQIGKEIPKYSLFSLSFWFKKNHIYDIPREEQNSNIKVKRWIFYPRLLILNLSSFLICTLSYYYLSAYSLWKIIFMIWGIVFLLFPLLGSWWMYWYDPYKEDRVLRKAYIYWCWIVLIIILIAFACQNNILNIKYLLTQILNELPHKGILLSKASLIILVSFAWYRSHADSKPFEKSIIEQGKALGINIDYGSWVSHMHHIYDFGIFYSALIIIFEVNI